MLWAVHFRVCHRNVNPPEIKTRNAVAFPRSARFELSGKLSRLWNASLCRPSESLLVLAAFCAGARLDVCAAVLPCSMHACRIACFCRTRLLRYNMHWLSLNRRHCEYCHFAGKFVWVKCFVRLFRFYVFTQCAVNKVRNARLFFFFVLNFDSCLEYIRIGILVFDLIHVCISIF